MLRTHIAARKTVSTQKEKFVLTCFGLERMMIELDGWMDCVVSPR